LDVHRSESWDKVTVLTEDGTTPIATAKIIDIGLTFSGAPEVEYENDERDYVQLNRLRKLG